MNTDDEKKELCVVGVRIAVLCDYNECASTESRKWNGFFYVEDQRFGKRSDF